MKKIIVRKLISTHMPFSAIKHTTYFDNVITVLIDMSAYY